MHIVPYRIDRTAGDIRSIVYEFDYTRQIDWNTGFGGRDAANDIFLPVLKGSRI